MLRRTLIVLTLLTPISTWSQNMWGTGMYGGMQSCPYPTRAGNGATNVDDGTKEIQSAISEAQKQLREKKAEKKKLDRTTEKARNEIVKTISDDYAEFIFEHVENSRRCQEYKGYQSTSQDFAAQGQEGTQEISNGNMIPVQSFTITEWSQYCDPTKAGSVSAGLCTNPRFKQSEGGRADAQSCKKGLTDYRKSYAQSQKLQREIERLEESIARTQEDLKEARQDALQAQRDNMTSQTEGGICIECMQQGNGYTYQKPQTDWSSVIANLGTGALATYMGYQQNKMVAEYNSNIGWPTQSYPSWGYGFPYIAAGIYGALGGGTGQGSFGCGSGMGGTMGGVTGNMNGPMGMMGGYGTGGLYGSMGGAFGYPSGMMGNMMGGGIYNSGMGPWGINGYGGGYGSNPMMGMGNMSGMGGMLGGGLGGMMGMGNMMGMGTMSGLGSMSGYDPTMLQMQSQYQQQMMQMQMQQYQSYMQYQQQYQQQYMQKYQAVSSLQQEMYNLMSRIQQIQYGYGTSGYLGSPTGTLGTTYYNNYNSSVITPLPGSSTSTIYTIPSSR